MSGKPALLNGAWHRRMASPLKEIVDHEDSSSSPDFAMVKLSSRRKRRRGSRGAQNLAAAKDSSSSSAKFMSVATDDLLLKIFLRLPNGRPVIQSAAVCKRWCSLIINPSPHKFIRTFIQYHLRKQSPNPSYCPGARTTSILFNYTKHKHGPYYQIPSKEPKPKPHDITFMPNWEDLAIRAASGDLLLLSHGVRRFFVCNSVTRQWLALPEVPRLENFAIDDHYIEHFDFTSSGFAIVRDPVDVEEYRYRYKVVLLHNCYFSPNDYCFSAAIFDSGIGQWTAIENFSFPYHPTVARSSTIGHPTDLEIAVASNGLLHWLDGERRLLGLVVFDPFLLKHRFVRLPAEQFGEVVPGYAKYNVRLGVVQGRVWLSLMEQGYTFYSLRVWELDSDSYTWLLVYEFDFEKTVVGKGVVFFVLAFDPHDGNVLYLVLREHIYRYEIEQDKYEMICEFPCDDEDEPVDRKRSRVASCLKVSTLVDPLWPTPTLSLPST